MKLKFFMRGLGLGILLTAVLISVGNPKEKLSDKEIISRAKDLGMEMKVENNSDLDQMLEDIIPTGKASEAAYTTPEAEPEPTTAPTSEPTVTPASASSSDPAKVPTANPTPEPTATPTPEPTAVPTVKPVEPTIKPTKVPVPDDGSESTDEQAENDGITFTISKGMSSGKVAALLKESGLIDDADAFNDYIEKTGKASIIRVGTYTMPVGSSFKDIVTEITMK